MRAYCIDGPKFGTLFDGSGMEVHFPFIDEQSNQEWGEWHALWGVADIWLYLDRDWDALDLIPPKPGLPVWVYRWAFDGPYGALVLRFDGERR